VRRRRLLLLPCRRGARTCCCCFAGVVHAPAAAVLQAWLKNVELLDHAQRGSASRSGLVVGVVGRGSQLQGVQDGGQGGVLVVYKGYTGAG